MKIVIRGSAKVKEKIFEIAKILENKGYEVVIPKEFFIDMEKSLASITHFNEICKKDTDIVLVCNYTKSGIENYIGPNTFADITIAFYNKKPVYLLKDIYSPYKDELEGWKVIPINDDLSKLPEPK